MRIFYVAVILAMMILGQSCVSEDRTRKEQLTGFWNFSKRTGNSTADKVQRRNRGICQH